jgi:MOSC domain-containing protein YiiM
MSELPKEGDIEIVSLNVSDRKGVRKKPVESIVLVEGSGIAGDAHAGVIENRQVSMLAFEDIEGANEALKAGRGAGCVKAPPEGIKPGDFAENITTRGVALHELPIGTKIELGETLLEVSKIGKECHAACEIRTLMGDCIMPRRGIFVRVLKGGEVSREDRGHYRVG